MPQDKEPIYTFTCKHWHVNGLVKVFVDKEGMLVLSNTRCKARIETSEVDTGKRVCHHALICQLCAFISGFEETY